MPIFGGVQLGHRGEENGEHVSEAEVEEHHLDQRPVLLVVVVLDEGDFQFLEFLKALGYFCDDKKPKKEENMRIQANVEDNKANIDNINDKTSFQVILKYLLQGLQLLSSLRFNSNRIVEDIYNEEQ